jgi:hypothetical protein
MVASQTRLPWVQNALNQYLSRPKPERAVRRVRSWLAD